MKNKLLSQVQEECLLRVAKTFEWDKLTQKELTLLLWCTFHYFIMRTGEERDE
jgi:hypothetical protein